MMKSEEVKTKGHIYVTEGIKQTWCFLQLSKLRHKRISPSFQSQFHKEYTYLCQVTG